MNKADYQQKKDKEAVSFFREFIRRVSRGKLRIVHFGWWSINDRRFSLSMTWETGDEE